MQNYTARTSFSNEEGQEFDILVISSRCQYHVWFGGGEITLRGPGVFEVSEKEQTFDNLEDHAISVVLLFENGLWPEEDNNGSQ